MRDEVLRVLSDGLWHTGLDIAKRCERASLSTGVAARVRELRNPKYGGYNIESEKDTEASKRTGMQVWHYRMVLGETKSAKDALPEDKSGQGLLFTDSMSSPVHTKFD